MDDEPPIGSMGDPAFVKSGKSRDARVRNRSFADLQILPENTTLEARDVISSFSGRGAAWLARLNGVQEVAGSNPVAPNDLRRSGLTDSED